MLTGNEDRITGILPPKKHYRCSHGHYWEANCVRAGLVIQMPGDTVTRQYCLYCLREMADMYLGLVTEVPEEP